MIVQTTFQNDPDGWVFVRTYSDAGFMVRQDETGVLYSEAIDPQWCNRTYTETDIPVDADSEEDDGSDDDLVHAAKILFGEE